MSHREFIALGVLEKWEKKYPFKEGMKSPETTIQYWENFVGELARLFNVRIEEVNAILVRLTRTGCFEPLTGTFWNYKGGHGTLTPIYYRIKNLVSGNAG